MSIEALRILRVQVEEKIPGADDLIRVATEDRLQYHNNLTGHWLDVPIVYAQGDDL